MIRARACLSVLAAALAAACASAPVPSDSETHFLSDCDMGCGALECICGVCTRPCPSACSDISASAACRPSGETPLDCASGESPPQRVCDVPCTEHAECRTLGEGFECVEGACRRAGFEVAAEPPASTSGSFGPPDPGLGLITDAGSEDAARPPMGSIPLK